MPRPKPAVLVVDRETRATAAMVRALRQHGFDARWARDAEAAFNAIDARSPVAVVTALRLRSIDGLAVLDRALGRNPEACVVMLAGAPDTELAIEAMRRGASDFQFRPVLIAKLLAVLDRGLAHQALAARASELERMLDERLALGGLTGRSAALERVMDQVRSVAPTRTPVLIEGEKGSGKSLVAQAIHRSSPRRGEPFAFLHCGALSGGLLESELFGQERTAPGGPMVLRRGRIELADAGTLFLDEIGAAPPGVQAQLLRVIQERAFERVGGTETLRADVRLIAATSEDLEARVRAGVFREDLLHRLGARIAMPALRERAEDLVPLIEVFIRESNRAHRRKVQGLSPGALERLTRHTWPSNVRELRDTIERMVASAEGRRPLGLADLPDAIRGDGAPQGALDVQVGMTVDEAERRLIAETLERLGHDKPRTAAMLGIGLRTLYRKVSKYGLG